MVTLPKPMKKWYAIRTEDKYCIIVIFQCSVFVYSDCGVAMNNNEGWP